MNVAEHREISLFQSTREHPRIAEVLEGDLAITFEAEVEEVEHLGDNGCSGLGEIEGESIFGTAEVV